MRYVNKKIFSGIVIMETDFPYFLPKEVDF